MASYPIQAHSPGGELLTIDSAYFGDPTPLRLFIVTSGIHGAEGLAGSALQQYCIGRLTDHSAIPDDCGALFVHALNPYGFAHLRRTNENNVDLNRNCLASFPGPTNSAYEVLNALLNPPSPPPREDRFVPKLLWRGLTKGPRAIRQAIAGGQYTFPKGLFYGGAKREKSIVIFEQILRNPIHVRAQHVLHIDLHAGLGRYGRYKLFSQAPEESRELQQLQEWFGASAVATSMSRRSGTYTASGPVGSLTKAVFNNAHVYTTTLEFGTYPLIQVLSALRRENQLHHYGAVKASFGRKIKAEFLEVFCPKDGRWRRAVLEQGDKVFRQATKGIFDIVASAG